MSSKNNSFSSSLGSTSVFGTALPVLSEFSTEKSLSENYLLKDEKEYSSNPTQTKLLCTIGPACSSKQMMADLIDENMSLARFNLSHNSKEEHRKLIAQLKMVSEEKRKLCAIIVDSRGSAIRMAATKGGKEKVAKGDEVVVCYGDISGEFSSRERIVVDEPRLCKLVKKDEEIRIGFGMIKLKVLGNSGSELKCQVLTDGILSSRKTVFLPKGRKKYNKEISKQDEEDIKFAVDVNADFLAASYITCGEHIRAIKAKLIDLKANHIKVIAKIECEEALINFASVMQESDGIMISRGNLGEEIALESVTLAQKLILRKCNSSGKPVITATQLLESMRFNPFPTRAEASDAGNAVFDGSDCVALAGETAIGAYPLESARMMSAILREAERSVDHRAIFRMVHERALALHNRLGVAEGVASSAVKLSYDLNASLLIGFSRSGLTGQLLAKYVPKCPVLLVTDCERVARQALISRGLVPLFVNSLDDDDALITRAMEVAKKMGFCSSGEMVVVVRACEKGSVDSFDGNMVSVVPVMV